MRLSLMSVCSVLLLAVLSSALPVAQPSEQVVLVELVPDQESLHTLNLGDPKTDASTREKRTIGFLRETFPTLSETIDRTLQTITRFIFRIIGRLVLGGGGGGGDGDSSNSGTSRSSGGASVSSSSSSQGRRISITLPTYPPSTDDDEEEDEEDSSPAASTNDVLAAASDNKAETVASSADRPEAKSRVARAVDQQVTAKDNTPAVDQESAAADENRDKRFLFGFGGGGSGGSSAPGGSGNFLFDIIRLIAGSGTTEEGNDAEHDTTGTGNGAAAVGYAAGAAAIQTPELDGKPDDGYTSGIPGPITRLFVIANRGISNLLQDLILRLAQTSERIVNFKARLITSII